MDDRRANVPFDPYYFEKLKQTGTALTAAGTFRLIYEKNHWNGPDSISGAGASRDQTLALETELPVLLQHLGVRHLLDLPCGDFSWMQHVTLPVTQYTGADIVPDLVAANQQRYGTPHRRFIHCDLTTDLLPDADLMLCRDCFVHLSFADISRAFQNLRQSHIRYLLTTTFPACEENEDITTGDWRVLNLEHPPFHLPSPLRLLNEQCREGEGRFADKSLGLWQVADLPMSR